MDFNSIGTLCALNYRYQAGEERMQKVLSLMCVAAECARHAQAALGEEFSRVLAKF